MVQAGGRRVDLSADGGGLKWVMLIYFCSGLCALIDEVIWVRLFKLVLGNTVYASSIVISVFMAGLALGAFLAAAFADRIQKRLRIYAILEVLVGVTAVLLPKALGLADGIYRGIFARFPDQPGVLVAAQVVISAAILLLPTMLMGSTLPLVARYVTSLKERVGGLVGKLYALNTFGAAAGCFLAGFVFIRAFGVMETLYIAAGLNLLVALAGLILSTRYEGASKRALAAATDGGGSTAQRQGFHWLMMAVFASGLVSIGYEIIWMRSVVFVMAGFTYVFSAVLTIYLIGNVIGAWIGSGIAKRFGNPQSIFALMLGCLGVLGLLYVPWLSVWDLKVKPSILSSMPDALRSQEIQALAWPMFQSIFLFLLPSIVMGIGFPLALQAWSNISHKVGKTTGTVYGINTLGAVAGGLVTGFVLIPMAGVQLSITILALAAFWAGLALFKAQPAGGHFKLALAIAAGVTVGAVLIPKDLFSKALLAMPQQKLIAMKEGVTTTVSVYKDPAGEMMLATSGIKVAGDHRDSFRIPQKLLGHLGILLNSNTRTALSVGFGSGETTACMSLYHLDAVHGVEIAPELVEVSLQNFQHINLGPRLGQYVKMIYMDAKNYMHLTNLRYDVIVNDCTNPKEVADNASLYTKEYFENARDCLKPGGIFASYLPIGEIPVSCIKSVLGTFAEVFPCVTIWFPTTAASAYDWFYIAGSKEPQAYSPTYIDGQLEKVRDSTAYVNFHNSHYVLSCFLGDKEGLRKYLNQYWLNSDFYPYIEFSTDVEESDKVKKKWLAEFITCVRSDPVGRYVDLKDMPADAQAKWLAEQKTYYNAATYLLKARVEPEIFPVLRLCSEGLKAAPGNAALIELESSTLDHVQKEVNSRTADAYLDTAKTMLATDPNLAAAWLVRSWALQQKNLWQDSLASAQKAVELAPYCGIALNNVAAVLLKLNEVDKAMEILTKAVAVSPNTTELYYNLALAQIRIGKPELGVISFRKGLQLQPLDIMARYLLGELLVRLNRNGEALAEYKRVFEINPDIRGLREKIKSLSQQ